MRGYAVFKKGGADACPRESCKTSTKVTRIPYGLP